MTKIIALLTIAIGIITIILSNPKDDQINYSSTQPIKQNDLTQKLIQRLNMSLINENSGHYLNQISQVSPKNHNSYSQKIDPSRFNLNPLGPLRLEYLAFPEEINNPKSKIMILISIFDRKNNNKIWEIMEIFENE
jgi:hypothetical protein